MSVTAKPGADGSEPGPSSTRTILPATPGKGMFSMDALDSLNPPPDDAAAADAGAGDDDKDKDYDVLDPVPYQPDLSRATYPEGCAGLAAVTPLHLAAGLGHPDIVASLLALPDATSHLQDTSSVLSVFLLQTPLHLAVEAGCLLSVSRLLEAGHPVDTPSVRVGHTALHRAVVRGDVALCRALLEAGVRFRQLRVTPHLPVSLSLPFCASSLPLFGSQVSWATRCCTALLSAATSPSAARCWACSSPACHPSPASLSLSLALFWCQVSWGTRRCTVLSCAATSPSAAHDSALKPLSFCARYRGPHGVAPRCPARRRRPLPRPARGRGAFLSLACHPSRPSLSLPLFVVPGIMGHAA